MAPGVPGRRSMSDTAWEGKLGGLGASNLAPDESESTAGSRVSHSFDRCRPQVTEMTTPVPD
jgi:hypothetical protein